MITHQLAEKGLFFAITPTLSKKEKK